MALDEYLEGAAWLAATVGLLGLSVALLARRHLAHLGGAPWLLGVACVFLCELIGVHVLALALGILSRPSVLAGALLTTLGTLGLDRRRRGEPPAPGRRHHRAGSRAPLGWVLASAVLALVVCDVAGFVHSHATSAVTASDFTLFHMPGVARWLQSGTLWANNVLLPDFPVGTYPNNGDVLFLAAALPWHNDAFVRLVNVPMLALVGVSVYALARELGAPRAVAATAAATLLSTQTVLTTALDRVKPEPLMLAMLGTGLMFLARHRHGARRADLVLAGLALGLAFGARWDGVTAVAIVLAVWALASLLADRQPVALARRLAGLIALVLASGGIWFVRNLVQTGDPVFPAPVRLAGIELFHAAYDPIRAHYDYTVAGYLFNGRVLSDSILPAYRVAFGVPGALALLGLVVAGGLALRIRRQARDGRVLALAAGGVAAFAVYLVTPGSAQGFANAPWPGLVLENARWAAAALLVGVAVGAWAAGRIPGGRVSLGLAALVGVIDGLRQGVSVSASEALVGAVLAGALALAAVALTLPLWRRRRPGRLALAGLGALAVLALAIGDHLQRRFIAHRYRQLDPTIDWVTAHAPAHHRVGIAGAFSGATGAPVLAMFGPGLENRVAYVGPWDGGFLRQYTAEPAYRAALARGRYDLMLVGRGLPPRDGGPPELWTLRAGYAPVARGADFVLMRRLTAAGGGAATVGAPR